MSNKINELLRKGITRISSTNMLNENLLYDDTISERIHPNLEEELRSNRHSLSGCDVFPEGDVISTEMKLIRERFKEVVLRCRGAYDVDVIDNQEIIRDMLPLLRHTINIEKGHIKELEELAIKMVLEEFGISDEEVVLEAKLISDSPSLEGTSKQSSPSVAEDEFDSHEQIVEANAMVKKRRVLNAMTQGAAKKVNHMFHMAYDELTNINPRLLENYKKLMSSADYMYFIQPDLNMSFTGGVCDVDFDGDEDEDGSRPVIKATAIVFPVLIHELVKGLMEVLSAHGLPSEKTIAEYVINKADFIEAEPWDMRLGPAMWGRFCDLIPDGDIELKYQVYAEIASLEPIEFNNTMKEILSKTKRGGNLIREIVDDIKLEIKNDDFNDAMGADYFDIEDLL